MLYPDCFGKKRLTIEEMPHIAEQRGGKCLSSNYKNVHSKLLWECFMGHQWNAAARSVKKGSWRPVCRKKIVVQQDND